MNVLLISDYSLQHTIGGAQRSNDIIIQEGVNRGHSVDLLTIDLKIEDFINKTYDHVISSNLEAFSVKKPEILDFLASIENHSRLEHDMCYYLSPEKRERLYSNCNHSFFLTDYHYQKFVEYYGNYFKNVRIVPDPISEEFRHINNRRSKSVLYVGFFHPLKGTNDFCQYVTDNPSTQFVVAGWGDPAYLSFFTNQPNVSFYGAVKHESMIDLYNYCDTIYCRPLVDEPFCRSFGEALCCGIKNFLINDRIGSYHMYQELDSISEFRRRCNIAHETFWDILEKGV